MRRAILGSVLMLTLSVGSGAAGDACQSGLCPTGVPNETACQADGLYVGLIGATLAESISRQGNGPPSAAAEVLSVNQLGVSATAVETSCESHHEVVALDLWSCGTSRVIGLEIALGAVHIVADELVVEACSEWGGSVSSGVTATFTGLAILTPGNAQLADVVADNTVIPLPFGLGTLYLDETSTTAVGECRQNRGNSLRLETPLLGTVIVGSVATNACTIFPQ